MNRASGTYGTITKDTFGSSESQKEKRKECGAEEIFEEIMTENFQNLAKDIKLTGSRAEEATDIQRVV